MRKNKQIITGLFFLNYFFHLSETQSEGVELNKAKQIETERVKTQYYKEDEVKKKKLLVNCMQRLG